jgi:hypothetical protein
MNYVQYFTRVLITDLSFACGSQSESYVVVPAKPKKLE